MEPGCFADRTTVCCATRLRGIDMKTLFIIADATITADKVLVL